MARKNLRHADAALLDAKAALRGRIADALEALKAPDALGDKAVHRVRRDLRRARAGLRLLRDAVGKPAYARENAALRDAARPLARVRDAKVGVETVKGLLAREKKAAARASLAALRRSLREERRAQRDMLERSKQIAETGKALDVAGRRVAQWRLPRDPWPVLAAGIERIYRRGRKALEEVEANPSDRSLHEWRKQVKYLCAALEILEVAKARRLSKLVKRADAVADRLGDDRDLAVLRARLATLPDKTLLSKVERRRSKLQKKALKQARRLYKQKPKAFLKRLEAARVRA